MRGRNGEPVSIMEFIRWLAVTRELGLSRAKTFPRKPEIAIYTFEAFLVEFEKNMISRAETSKEIQLYQKVGSFDYYILKMYY